MMQQAMDSTMQTPVTRSEVLDIAAYEQVRPGFREEVLATSLQQGTNTQHEVDVGGAGLLIGMVVAPRGTSS